MDRKELYQNVRKAYRLIYEVQDSIIDMVEYIGTRIKTNDQAGKQVFSNPVSKHYLDKYATDYIGKDMWSWDYFPTFMYMYYFSGVSTETQDCCFSIIQVMDDGFIGVPDEGSAPSTKDFKPSAESESYLIFAFSIWDKDRSYIWYNLDEKEIKHDVDESDEIIRISEIIKADGNNRPYIKQNQDKTSIFIVTRINLESMGSKMEVDQALQAFANLVQKETGYQILIDETQEDTP